MKLSFLRPLIWICALAGLAAQQTHAQGTVISTALDVMARPASGLVGLTTTGALVRSTDNGASFTTVVAANALVGSPTSITYPRGPFALAASGSTVIAMGDSGWFVRSTDNGLTYTTFAPSVTPAFVGAINALAFADGKWVGVGYKGSVVTTVTSPTGIAGTWSASTIANAPGGQLRGVTWTGARWVAVGGNGGAVGYVFTSTDGANWTKIANTAFPSSLAPGSLNAVASDGAGKVLAVGYAGTMLYSTDGGLTYSDVGGFSTYGVNVVSEDLRSVLFRSGTQWVVGGDAAALLHFDSSLAAGQQTTSLYDPVGTTPITALIADTVAGNYLFSSSYTPPGVVNIGPISLSIDTVSNQLQLTLVGATNTVSYYTESSSDLVTWTPVGGSTRTFNGVDPVVWTYALPGPGGRIFYRAKSGLTP